MIARLVQMRLRENFLIHFSVAAAILFLAVPWFGSATAIPLILPLVVQMRRRARVFESGLPIAGGTLALSAVTASLILAWIPLGALLIAAVVRHDTELSPLMRCQVAAVLTMVMMLPHAIRKGEIAEPSRAAFMGAVVVLGIAAGLLVYLVPPTVGVAALTAGVILMFGYTVSGVPVALQIIPRKPSTALTVGLWVDESATEATTVPWWRVYVRSLSGQAFLWGAAMFVMGATNDSFVYVWIATTVIAVASRSRSKWLNAFPLPTRQRMLICHAPTMIAIMGGLGLGTLAGPRFTFLHDFIGRGAPRLPDVTPYDFSRANTNAGLEYWSHASSGSAPLSVAPWGESIAPDTITVLGELFYNPYTTRDERSARFRTWQFARLTTTVYGRPMTEPEYRAERGDLVRLTNRGWMGVAGWVGTGAAVLLFLVFSELGRSYVFTRTNRGRRIAMAIGLIPMLVFVVLDMGLEARRGTTLFVPLSRWLMLHADYSTTTRASLGVLGAVAVLAVLFKLLEWLFGQAETIEKDPRAAVPVS